MAKILIYSPHPIKESMAGAAIRVWEFAKALSANHRVVLITREQSECHPNGFECVSLQDCKVQFRGADLLIVQRLTVPLALLASAHGVKVIVDAYDPSPLELLEYYKKESL